MTHLYLGKRCICGAVFKLALIAAINFECEIIKKETVISVNNNVSGVISFPRRVLLLSRG